MLLQLYKRFGAHTRNWQEAMEERQKNKKKHACHLPNPVLKRNLHMLKHAMKQKHDPATKSNGRTAAPKPGLASTHKFGIIFGTETCQDVQSPRKR
jgi:Mn-containing catalase